MMSRRDILAAIANLPDLQSIEIARLEPTDTVVLTLDKPVSADMQQSMMDALRTIWPEPQKVIVLEKGTTLNVIRKTDCEGS